MQKSGLLKSLLARTALLGCGALATATALTVTPPTWAEGNAGPTVAVTGGQIQGRLLPAPGGAVFKAIPYAAPPTGDNRWREPQPIKAWTGVRQAADYGADCPPVVGGIEYSAAFGGTLNQGAAAPGRGAPAEERQRRATSEDCLFLNVWAPEWPSKGKKAVMMWIHGGELAGGSGALRDGPAPDAEASLSR